MGDNAQPLVNPFAVPQHMLVERLYYFLATLHPSLYADAVKALEEEGKLLFLPQGDANLPSSALVAGVWPLLTLLVAQQISPNVDLKCASSVAVAVECFVCAIDLLDDIIDGDQTPTVQALGEARTLNTSTALLTLAQQAILSLSRQDVDATLILRLLNTLQESALVVTAGQQQDVLAEQRPVQDFTREDCIEIAAAKAGSIMRLACRLGALCAGANETVCELFSEFGELLGIAHQLDNDSHDMYHILQDDTFTAMPSGAGSTIRIAKSDLERGKKTLPVVLAARIENALQKKPLSVDEEKKEHLRALHEGITTTWGICLLYRERAHDRLQEIEVQHSINPELRLLLGFD